MILRTPSLRQTTLPRDDAAVSEASDAEPSVAEATSVAETEAGA